MKKIIISLILVGILVVAAVAGVFICDSGENMAPEKPVSGIVVLSPHFDDAIGSAGGVIRRMVADGRDVSVMTFMTRRPSIINFRSYMYVGHRIAENRAAVDVVGARVIDAPFLDAKYRDIYKKNKREKGKAGLFSDHVTETPLVNEIKDYILDNTSDDAILVAPAGLGGHIDHLIVRAAVADIPRTVYYYEEFYYDIKNKNAPLTADFETVLLSDAELESKIESMGHYKKTLRNLFRKDTMNAMRKYYEDFRVADGRSYEKFNSTGFLK